MSCRICGRRTTDDRALCWLHERALANLKTNYEKWKIAASLDWDEYLEQVRGLDGTGIWVKVSNDYLRSVDDSEGE